MLDCKYLWHYVYSVQGHGTACPAPLVLAIYSTRLYYP